MTEIERVYDAEVVEEPEGMEWQTAVSEWAEGSRQEFVGQLRQARAAALVVRRYGRASIKEFAQEVGSGKSKVYDYCRVWQVYGHLFEDGDFSGRLETRSISHYIAALNAPDPVTLLETSEDEDLSVRQIQERVKVAEEAEHGGAEVVTETRACPTCNGSGEIPSDG